MDAAAEIGRNPSSKHQIQSEIWRMRRLTRDVTTEPVSRDQILRHVRGQGNIHFPCSADHQEDWQPYHTLLYVMTIQTYVQENESLNGALGLELHRCMHTKETSELSHG